MSQGNRRRRRPDPGARRRTGPHRSRRSRGNSTQRPGFSHERALILGVIQILTGSAVILLGVVAITAKTWGWEYGGGLWGGSCCVAAGVFGLASSRQKSTCTIVTFMVLSTAATILALVILTLSAIGLASDRMLHEDLRKRDGRALVIQSLIIVVMTIESVCGAMAAIVGCKGVCGAWYGDAEEEDPAVYDAASVCLDADDVHHLDGIHGAFPPVQPAIPHISVVPMPFPTEGSTGGYIMHSSTTGPAAVNQITYVLPTGTSPPPFPQPGTVPSEYQPPVTPPPSYSTCQMDRVGLGEGRGRADSDEDLGPSHGNRDPLSLSEAQLHALLSQASVRVGRDARNVWNPRGETENARDREVVGARLASTNARSQDDVVSGSHEETSPTRPGVTSASVPATSEPTRTSTNRNTFVRPTTRSILPNFAVLNPVRSRGAGERGRAAPESQTMAPPVSASVLSEQHPVSSSPSRHIETSSPTVDSPTANSPWVRLEDELTSPEDTSTSDSPWIRSQNMTSSQRDNVLSSTSSPEAEEHPLTESAEPGCNNGTADNVYEEETPLTTAL